MCKNLLFSNILLFIDLCFIISINIFQNSFLISNSFSSKFKIILISSSFIILFFLIILLYRNTFLSKIILILYAIIGFGFFIYSCVLQIMELIYPSKKYRENYTNNHIDLLILALTILTIFLRIICISYMRTYIEILKVKEKFIRGKEHDKFLEDLESKIEESNVQWSMSQNKKEIKIKKKYEKLLEEESD